MNSTAQNAQERRKQLQRDAAEMGVDEAYISILVETFYDRVREDPELGPIFIPVIGDNWNYHLGRMKTFWASVILKTGQYSGRPVPAHMKLEGLGPEHFKIWLGLFRSVLDETAPSREAVPLFMGHAERIANSLQLAKFGLPGLPEPGGHGVTPKKPA